MYLSRTNGYLAALAAFAIVFAIGTAQDLAIALSPLLQIFPLTVGAPLQTFQFAVGGANYELQEVDVGAKFGCPDSTRYVGVILKGHGITRWSFNVDDAESKAHSGCYPGADESRIVGVAVPTGEDAVWVVETTICGVSCAASAVDVFRFWTRLAQIDPRSGKYTRGAVDEEISQSLGHGGVRFEFPRLVLYVNNGYKECPSHFTRMIYAWARIDNYEKFILIDAVAYTSRVCGGQGPWPPDPEQ